MVLWKEEFLVPHERDDVLSRYGVLPGTNFKFKDS